MFTWCIIVGHKTKPPKSKLKRIVARNAAKKHLFAPLSSPHISSSSFSFMPLFFGSHSSCCLHLLPMPSFSFTFSLSLNIPLLLRDTLPGEPLICFLWSASVFRDALSIAASLSHQPSVSLDFGSLPKHFFFFLGHHQFCATALSSSVALAWDVAVCLCRHMQASLVADREKLLQCVCVSVCVCCVARVS